MAEWLVSVAVGAVLITLFEVSISRGTKCQKKQEPPTLKAAAPKPLRKEPQDIGQMDRPHTWLM